MANSTKKIKPIKPYRDGTRVLVHGRLSYANLFEPREQKGGGEKKYETVLLIPKSDTASYEAVNAALEQAKQEGIASKWKGKLPKKLATCLNDGDESDNESFQGYWYFNTKSAKKPRVVNVAKEDITDPEKVYSGCWAVLNVKAFPYEASGNNGVSLGLNAVMKTYDDEPLAGGGGNAVADFDKLDMDMSSFTTGADADQVDDDDL